ncbi:MAG: GGDEF domain-containing protein [Burkholderiales bacterium]|nr:GGDEF domain-containing protein [Burkholderiales bacterium]
MRFFDLSRLRPLPPAAERELSAQHDAEIRQLLPILGPLFGLAVILFNVWDHLIAPQQAWGTLAVRLGLVGVGSLAYLPTRLPWNAVQRCGFIYWTHVCAIILSEFLLQNGFLYGLSGLTACVFTVSVITLRVTTYLLILSVPSLLFVLLSAISLPWLMVVNGLMMYLFALSLAGIVMLVIRSSRQKAYLSEQQLLHLSRHDSLTGAYNRGYLTELAERELAVSRRYGRPLAVAMLDIDHFKQVNDNYGHAVGDRAIQALVDACTQNLRAIDHFGRTGGEEFVCVLPETGDAEAVLCAERLRLCLAALGIATEQGNLQFTVSIGVAVLNSRHADWDALLKDADSALYRAKREGRNRVVLAPPPVR